MQDVRFAPSGRTEPVHLASAVSGREVEPAFGFLDRGARSKQILPLSRRFDGADDDRGSNRPSRRNVLAPRRVLVGFNGSESAYRALRVGLHFAAMENAECVVLTVLEVPRFSEPPGETQEEIEAAKPTIRKLQEAVRTQARRQGVSVRTSIVVGRPADAIVRYSKQHRFEFVVVAKRTFRGSAGCF